MTKIMFLSFINRLKSLRCYKIWCAKLNFDVSIICLSMRTQVYYVYILTNTDHNILNWGAGQLEIFVIFPAGIPNSDSQN
jgi:hypothetical protein